MRQVHRPGNIHFKKSHKSAQGITWNLPVSHQASLRTENAHLHIKELHQDENILYNQTFCAIKLLPSHYN